MSQFVNGFFEQPLTEQGIIALQPIKFLPQPVDRDQSARSANLSFSEDIF